MMVNSDIAFKDYRKKDIHGSCLYPATMVAPVQSLILRQLFNKENIQTVFDPFHGSGTALYEAMQLNPNSYVYGCDINPFANLITKSKLLGVSPTIHDDLALLTKLLSSKAKVNDFSFPNINKWFRQDIITSLSKIKWAINQIESQENRFFCWTILSTLIRRYSNTRSSTYKLHIKEPEKINLLSNDLCTEYLRQLESNIDKFNFNTSNFKLYKHDVINVLKDLSTNSMDLMVTSPPYGDNATTVTYGQFSSLPLYWIDKQDLELEGWELNNYSSIDYHSLGGSNKCQLCEQDLDLLTQYLEEISVRKQKKVKQFFGDYFYVMSELCRITRVYAVLTLGNRTVDGVKINLTEITKKYFERNGFVQEDLLSRDIPYKRIPSKLRTNNNELISSMNKEYVLILKKIN